MALAIEGIDPKRVYYPGDALDGTVAWIIDRKATPLEIDEIKVSFEGSSDTKYSVSSGHRTNVYRSSIVLFRMEQVLFEGPYKVGSTQRWNFSFHVPDRVTVNTTEKPMPAVGYQHLFDGADEQEPPPCLSLEVRGTDNEIRCYIKYVLSAELVTRARFGKKKSTMTLRVEPLRGSRELVPEMLSYTSSFVAESRLLDPRSADRKPTAREKLKSALHRDKRLPKLDYEITVDFPDSAILGQSVPVFLGARVKENSSVATLPPIELKRCSVILIRKVSAIMQPAAGVRSPFGVVYTFESAKRIGIWPDPYKPYLGPSTTINHRIDLRELMTNQLKLRADSACADFLSYNISETHSFALRLTIELVGEEVQVEMKSKPIVLLPQYCQPTEMDDIDAMSDPSMIATGLGNIPLPSYTDAWGS